MNLDLAYNTIDGLIPGIPLFRNGTGWDGATLPLIPAMPTSPPGTIKKPPAC